MRTPALTVLAACLAVFLATSVVADDDLNRVFIRCDCNEQHTIAINAVIVVNMSRSDPQSIQDLFGDHVMSTCQLSALPELGNMWVQGAQYNWTDDAQLVRENDMLCVLGASEHSQQHAHTHHRQVKPKRTTIARSHAHVVPPPPGPSDFSIRPFRINLFCSKAAPYTLIIPVVPVDSSGQQYMVSDVLAEAVSRCGIQSNGLWISTALASNFQLPLDVPVQEWIQDFDNLSLL